MNIGSKQVSGASYAAMAASYIQQADPTGDKGLQATDVAQDVKRAVLAE